MFVPEEAAHGMGCCVMRGEGDELGEGLVCVRGWMEGRKERETRASFLPTKWKRKRASHTLHALHMFT